VYRPQCRSTEDPALVCDAPAVGSNLPGDASASGIRDTQRQWSDLAIRRTTPALLGLFSLFTMFAHPWMRQPTGAFRRQAAWYRRKAQPTFSDALALVRKELWAQEETFYGSPWEPDTIKVPRAFVERLTDAACYAA
jgi:hypothetical protein